MVQILAPFFILSVISGSCLSLALRTKRVTEVVPKGVREDFQNITTGIKAFDASITAFSGTLEGAMVLDSEGRVTVAALRNGTRDVNSAPPFTENESQRILDEVEAIAPTIKDSLTTLVVKKPMIEKLNVKKETHDGLKFMATATDDFMTALTLKATPDSQHCLKRHQKTLAKAFAVAINAFK